MDLAGLTFFNLILSLKVDHRFSIRLRYNILVDLLLFLIHKYVNRKTRDLTRDDGGVGDEWEVDTWVGHQVGLELGQIHVEGTIEAQGGGDGGHDLADQTVEVGVGGALDVQVAAADVVDGLVVDHEGAVGVLQGGVGGQDGVVGLDHSSGDLKEKTQVNRLFTDVCSF